MENQIPSIEEIKRMTDANKINKLLLESLSKEQVQAINTAYFNKKSIDILASNRKLIPFLTKNQIDSMKKPLSDVINLPRIDNGFYDLFGPLDDIPKIESVYFLISAMSVDQVLQLYTPSFYESWHFIRFLDSESIKYLYGEKLEAIINNKIMDFDLIVYLAPSQIASIKDTNAKISIAPYLTLDQTEKFLWPESSYLTTEEEVQKLNAKYLTEASIILLYHKKSLKFLSEWQFQALKPECFDKNSIKLFQANNLLRYISLDQIKQIKNTDTINALIPHLKSEDEQITKNRAQTLVANSFDQESITLLHDNGLLECLSTDQINQIEDSDAINVLIPYLKSENEQITKNRVQALVANRFNQKSITLLHDNGLLECLSTDQINQIEDTDAINALIPYLKSENEQITKNRVQALVANRFNQKSITLLHDNGLLECLSTDQINQIEDTDAINALIPYLKSENEQITKNRVQALVANSFDQESINLLAVNMLTSYLTASQINSTSSEINAQLLALNGTALTERSVELLARNYLLKYLDKNQTDKICNFINQIHNTEKINALIPHLKSEDTQITKKRVQALYACDFDQESINLLDKHASSLTPQQINQIHNTNAINALIPHLNNEDQIQALYACDFNQKSINLLDKHASSLTPQQIKQIKGTKKINALIPHLNTKKQVKELSAKKFSAKTIVKLYNSNKLGCLTEGQVKKLNVNCLNTFLIMAIVKADLLKHLTSKQVKNLDAAEFDSDVIISLNKNNLLLHLTAEQIQKIDISRLDIKAITVLIKNNLLTSEQIKALDASTLTELIIKLGLCPKLLRSLNLSDNNVTKLQKIVSTNSNHKPSWSMKKAKTAQIKSILDNANQEQQNIPVVTQEQQI